MDIANYIHELRDAAGFTLMELAEKTGLSASFLSDIERGRTDPSMKTLRKLAAAFGADLDVRFVRGGETYIPDGVLLCSRDFLDSVAFDLRCLADGLQQHKESEGA